MRVLAGALLAAVTLLLLAPPAGAGTRPAAVEPSPSATATGAAGDASTAPVVLVGVTGLRWDDVTTLTTPALWDLSRDGSVGLVAARSVELRSCPADGWLAVSSGERASDLPADDRRCRTLREPGEDGLVPGWTDYQASARAESYGARPGLLGDLLDGSGTAATGIGPGAAIALADGDGLPVGTHVPRPTTTSGLTRAVRDALATSRLVVVDAGVIRDPGYATAPRASSTLPEDQEPADEIPGLPGATDPELPSPDAIVEPSRAAQAQTLDDRIGAVLRATERSGATVLVVSLADSSRTTLQLAAATGTAPDGDAYAENLLTSGATRQAGLVQTADVTPTLLDALDLEDEAPALAGATILPVAGPPTAAGRMAVLLDVQDKALWVTRVSGGFSTRMVLVQAVLFVAAAVILTRKGRSDRAPLRPALQVLKVAALALAAAPVTAFLTGVVPWWRASDPRAAFWWTVLGWIALITALALAGPWRRSVLGPAGFVAAVTVGVLVVDACTGSHLVIDTPMGAHRLLAARFYGMSNQAFALLTAAGLLVAVAIADPLVRRGRRTLATVLVAGLGLLLVVVDGAPGLGSDFGGPPALILAFALLAIVVSGRSVNWKVLAVVLGVGALVVGGFAVLDWMRPPADRTHLGRFFATVLDGGLWDVVYRKLSVNLRVLTNWRYLVLAVGGVALTWIVVAGDRPGRGALMGPRSPLAGLQAAVPLLRPAVAAIGAGLGVGFLMNDSGIVVPATGIAVAVPCLVAAAAQWRLGAPEGTPVPADAGPSGVAADGEDRAAPRAGQADGAEQVREEPAVSGASAADADAARPSAAPPTPPPARGAH
ncbi:hypothetical protein Celf_3607 [Cellulomonas fimi ATCC 484]|uniref:Uncharacterized protein n=1 Tax=Cellulomonas fimi (strain ATCC 484 / DSM 20113 / JCM 1341 / CCUG 24087 / LMG 16345 / NBRC 15513 / NCIMB 8980 / NCTC 7547 / NRS-133) TaxID=590998 RepID=F4H3P9_CELFA|nr:hypothetical protein Celf_3607 [Cellulomonas fimi ATCC 484]VEH36857.1 Uncharacterised protein [Cellulomonas fimi]